LRRFVEFADLADNVEKPEQTSASETIRIAWTYKAEKDKLYMKFPQYLIFFSQNNNRLTG